ncbi:MAG: hypothetical protein ACKVTZ_14865 [Bacteroidia bacterium]
MKKAKVILQILFALFLMAAIVWMMGQSVSATTESQSSKKEMSNTPLSKLIEKGENYLPSI